MPEGRPTQSLTERLAAAEARAHSLLGNTRATATQVAQKAKVRAAHQEEIEEAVEEKKAQATEADIKNNPFYQIFNNTALSQEDQIAEMANALDPKLLPMDKINENYRLFQEFFNKVQEEDTRKILADVKDLIEQLKDSGKIETLKILTDLRAMLDDVNKSKELVEVLKQARLSGQTVKELITAIDRNDEVVKQLDALKTQKELAEKAAQTAKAIVDEKIAERNAEEGKLSSRLFGLVRKDTTYSDRVTAAEKVAADKATAVTAIDKKIAQLSAERRTDLENGPLTILRSLDEVDDNLSQRIIASGENGIKTVEGALISAGKLMSRALFIESKVGRAAEQINAHQITLTVLQAALKQASKSTIEHKETLEAKQFGVDAALTEAKVPEDGNPDVFKIAKHETEATKLKASVGDVIDYQTRLGDTISEMDVAATAIIESISENDSQKKIVQGSKKSILMLGRDTMHTVSGDLRAVMHNLMADQTDETQKAIVEFARAAEGIKQGTLESMMARQKEMHEKDIALYDDTIKRLNQSTDLITQTLERAVDEGIDRAARQQELAAATAGLSEATTSMRRVASKMSEEGVRPGRPAADPTASVGTPDVPAA